jgi:hypothetical protein
MSLSTFIKPAYTKKAINLSISSRLVDYLLKHFLSEEEPKELKLTVHTSGESLIKMDPDMSVRGKIWENIPSVRIIKSLVHYGA